MSDLCQRLEAMLPKAVEKSFAQRVHFTESRICFRIIGKPHGALLCSKRFG